MRPRLHRAVLRRFAARLAVFAALVVAYFTVGDGVWFMGLEPAVAKGAMLVLGAGVLFSPYAVSAIRPTRARVTRPRQMASGAASQA